MKIEHYADDALLLSVTDAVQDSAAPYIHALTKRLEALTLFDDITAGYDSVMAQYDPLTLSHEAAYEALSKAAQNAHITSNTHPNIIELPVCYGGEYGPDMDTACTALSLSQDEIIALHSAKPYLVCMLGFIPGFTFLSAANARLHMPRRASPRPHVAAGSVGIAGWQAGIYALDSPGGWQILGRTPFSVFNAKNANPFTFKAGDYVRFKPITPAQFKAL